MTIGQCRAALRDHPDVGAGNVLPTLLKLGVDPSGPGLIFDTPVDGHEAMYRFTLGELTERVRTRAAHLAGQGIRSRDPVAIYAVSAADQVLTSLALMWLGAIPAPVNGYLSAEIVAEYIRRLRPVAVLADDARVATLGKQGTAAQPVSSLSAGDPATAPEPYRHSASDPIAITHSSGTTGIPKAVVHHHDTLFGSTRHRLSMPMSDGAERMLSSLPTPHAATVIAVNLALSNRAELLMVSSHEGAVTLDAIESFRPGTVLGFAVTWSNLAGVDLSTRDLDSVKVWWNTGDAVHETHIRNLVAVGRHREVTRQGVVEKAGSRFVDGLGSTEMGHSMFHITHSSDTNRYGRCIGHKHSFVEVEIVDPDGRVLPTGQIGELAVKSPTLAPGYWNDSVTTYRTRLRGFFLTGDLVYRDDDGYYYHVDRKVDAVRLANGTWLYTALSEERILAACTEVVDCTVSAVATDDGTITDVMLIMPGAAEPATDLTERVLAALGADAAATVRDVRTVNREDLPTGATGKIRKKLVRQSQIGETVGAVQ
ncbi:MAG: class I adenylate-forming enzyme family protein [Actinocatenispora sp.]